MFWDVGGNFMASGVSLCTNISWEVPKEGAAASIICLGDSLRLENQRVIEGIEKSRIYIYIVIGYIFCLFNAYIFS